MSTVLVVEHEADDPISWFGPRLAAGGLRVLELRAHAGDDVPTTVPDEVNGLIVLGGYMGADDDAQHRWLTDTKALIRDAVDAAIPLLGICLGHQLAASALGGQVQRNPAGRALGLIPVALTPAGQGDVLLAGTDGHSALQYNDDIVTRLPAGATTLAVAPDGSIQAARYGPAAWGVQFHPELTPATFAGWLDSDAELPASVRHGLAAAAAGAVEDLRESWLPFADRFAAQVLHRAG